MGISVNFGEDVVITANGITVDLTWLDNYFSGIVYFGTSDPVNVLTEGDDFLFSTSETLSAVHGGLGDDTILYFDAEQTYDLGRPRPRVADPVRLNGGPGNDFISGSELNDILHGGLGYDTLVYAWSLWGVNIDLASGFAAGGSAQGDVIIGFEAVWGSSFNDRLKGTDGRNGLMGHGGADWLEGRGGNDTLVGGLGADTLIGGTGRDVMQGGDGWDWLYAHGDGETLDGGMGIDHVLYQYASSALTVDLLSGTVAFEGRAVTDRLISIEEFSGSRFGDAISGRARADWIDGVAGHDMIDGRGGDDVLIGGYGRDTLIGGAGADSLNGGESNDILFANGDGDRLDGGGGIDRVVYADATGGLTADLSLGRAQIDGLEATDRLFNIEQVYGTVFDDYVRGSLSDDLIAGANGSDVLEGWAGHDTLWGGAGDDTLRGSWGNDKIYGHSGNDILNGSMGDDYLHGGSGSDRLWGGDGADSFVLVASERSGQDVIVDFGNNVDSLVLTGFGFATVDDLRPLASYTTEGDLLLTFDDQSVILRDLTLVQLLNDVVLA